MPNSLVSRDKFAQLAQTGAELADTSVAIPFTVEVKAESEDKRQLTFTISTGTVDRSGDTVSIDGWKLESYKKNPVVLWAHDRYSLPVARSLDVWAEKKSLVSTAEFAPAEVYAFADTVYRMYKMEFLSAVSVGFQPTKWAFTEDKDRKYGIDFIEQELMEYSGVVVPANAEALIQARSAGVDVEPLYEHAASVMKTRGVKDIRSLEDYLRDVGGYSRTQAKAIASHGWNALRDAEREAELAAGVIRALTDFRASLR